MGGIAAIATPVCVLAVASIPVAAVVGSVADATRALVTAVRSINTGVNRGCLRGGRSRNGRRCGGWCTGGGFGACFDAGEGRLVWGEALGCIQFVASKKASKFWARAVKV